MKLRLKNGLTKRGRYVSSERARGRIVVGKCVWEWMWNPLFSRAPSPFYTRLCCFTPPISSLPLAHPIAKISEFFSLASARMSQPPEISIDLCQRNGNNLDPLFGIFLFEVEVKRSHHQLRPHAYESSGPRTNVGPRAKLQIVNSLNLSSGCSILSLIFWISVSHLQLLCSRHCEDCYWWWLIPVLPSFGWPSLVTWYFVRRLVESCDFRMCLCAVC